MTKEAEVHASEDARKKESIEVKNNADSLIFTAEKTLKDAGEKAPAEMKKEVEDKIAAAKEAVKGGDAAAIKAKTDDLSASLQKVGQAMYASQGNSQQSTGNSQEQGEQPKEEPKKGDTVEGEVVE